MNAQRIHGGPGPAGPARFDFSTTANACGPHLPTLQAVRMADYSCYPDPSYRALRERLAEQHGVHANDVLLAASASEFIFRATAVSLPGPVCVPAHGFGDYAAAALAFQRQVTCDATGATLIWHANPSSPIGVAAPWPRGAPAQNALRVLDRACEPLRFVDSGLTLATPAIELWSPNKALGLTGVRGAYAIAPQGCVWRTALEAACPSWPLGADGVAMLTSWAQPSTQAWVAQSRVTLADWKARQTAGLQRLVFEVRESVVNFSLVRPPARKAFGVIAASLAQAGIAWRDAASFGLPETWRVSVQAPQAQDFLFNVMEQALA